MRELNFGGWLAPKIYYLGAAGCVNMRLNLAKFKSKVPDLTDDQELSILRILGVSGIFKPYSFFQDHPILPFDKDTKRSCYHVRQLETLRGLLLNNKKGKKLDICIGHDWPRGAHKYGDYAGLIKVKPFFERDIRSGKFGNPTSTLLLNTLKP
jgi:lariat debranching enzyme